MSDIIWIQTGQSRPYADSVYTGTVMAESEDSARDKIRQACGWDSRILDKQDAENWHLPHFTMLREVEPGKWYFLFVIAFTG